MANKHNYTRHYSPEAPHPASPAPGPQRHHLVMSGLDRVYQWGSQWHQLSLAQRARLLSLIFHCSLLVAIIVGITPWWQQPPLELAQPLEVEMVSEAAAERLTAAHKPMPPKSVKQPTPAKHDMGSKHPKLAPQVVPPKTNLDAIPQTTPSEFVVKPKTVTQNKAVKAQPSVIPAPPKLKTEPDLDEIEKVVTNLAQHKTRNNKALPPIKKDNTPELEELAALEKKLAQLDQDKKPAAPVRQAKSNRSGSELSLSEQDAIKRQLAVCWSLQAGAQNAEKLLVELELQLNPDGTIVDAKVTDRYKITNSYHRAAADSALRAVHDKRCSRLRLPIAKYDSWKRMRVVFNPQEMF